MSSDTPATRPAEPYPTVRRHPAIRRWLAGLAVLAAFAGVNVAAALNHTPSAAGAAPQSLAGPGPQQDPGQSHGASAFPSPSSTGTSRDSARPAAGQASSGTPGSIASQPPATSTPPGATPSADDRSGVSGGALFGGDVPLVSQQPRLGRPLAIVRLYYLIGQRFDDAKVRQIMAAGSTLLVSLDTRQGQYDYASIAAGREDATISAFLRSMEQEAVAYHLPAIYICFEHEADSVTHHSGLGTPAQFVQAWDHIHQLATDAGLDWNQGGRLHWVWILTHRAFYSSVASSFWPGSNETDIVGVDGYNGGTCGRARPGSNTIGDGGATVDPASLFTSAVNFAKAHGGAPVFVAEWGSIPYRSTAVQPGFIRQMQDFVASNPAIAAVLYWDSHAKGNGCDFSLNAYPDSVAALGTMARSFELQGRLR
jgi:hypothetical protein